MIELSSSAKKSTVKMLLDSSATGNFLLEAMATTLKLQAQDDEDFHELTLANGTVMPATRYVQFVMNYGDYKGKIMAKVFPKRYKECILGMSWLEYKNPIIDWTRRQVPIQ